MYYHRVIVNFRKTTSSPYFLHILVNIPQDRTDLAVYPRNFSGVYMIAYGIVGTANDVDPDKVYDYHTAFDIKPTEVGTMLILMQIKRQLEISNLIETGIIVLQQLEW